MKIARSVRKKAVAGFTLLESMVALSIFGAVGYSLMIVVDVGNHSQKTVARVAAENQSLRTAALSLIDELRTSTDTTITVVALPDGNHRLRFMLPIDVGGALGWGVYDKTLGPDAPSQNRANWSVQYTVRDVPNGNGTVVKQLLRQLLDDTQSVQKETVIAEGLHSGTDVHPGFTVVKTGDVWAVTLSTEGHVEGKAGIRAVFHVQTRN